MVVKSLKVFLLIVFVLSLLLYRTVGNLIRQKQGKIASPGLPVQLIIPKITLNTNIEYMGVTSQGVMEVPDNTINVGWFKLGPRPGEQNSAVIAGHLDGKNGEKGVFADLDKLKKGDKVFIKDNNGSSFVFMVRETRIYDLGYANDVFNASESAHLNLITCDGIWDGEQKSYNKRLVVFTDLLP